MLDKNVIKKLILEYQDFTSRIEYVPRDIDIDFSRCNVFVGLRRTGKSFLMYQSIDTLKCEGLDPRSILYFNFEDDRITGIESSDLDLIKVCYEELYALKPVFFLDEIQVVPGWEKFARRLADTGYRVFITGSNAKMLSSEIATTLGGRYALTEVFPFSEREYLVMNAVMPDENWEYRQDTEIRRLFGPYFSLGGLPEVIQSADIFKRKWLSSLFDRIYFGDLIARNGIRKQEGLKILIRKMTESIGQPLSINRMASIAKAAGYPMKSDTAAEYCAAILETWLSFGIENFAGKLTEKSSTRKYYFIDNGFITLFKEGQQNALLENLVAVALRKKFGRELYYYLHNVEVDFYIPDRDMAVQASLTIADDATRQRQVQALCALHKIRPLRRALIITYDDPEDIIRSESGPEISVVPVWKWLLLADRQTE